jgi:hypothetical protein
VALNAYDIGDHHMNSNPLDSDPRKVRPMPPPRQPSQGRYQERDRDPDAFSNVQLATILTKLEEGLVSHTRAIDANAQVTQEQGRNISQIILAMSGVNDALSTVKASLERIDHSQQNFTEVRDSEHASMRADIQTCKASAAAHELRITAIETAANKAGNRLFEIGQRSIGWIIAGITFLLAAVQFLAGHYKP